MELILAFIIYVVIGVVAGVIGGLLGIGGGSVTVPALLGVFTLLGLPQAYIMHLAIGTSLAAMVINTISASWAHHTRNAVNWQLVKRIIPGIVIGSIIGSLIAHELSGIILEIIFGLFACAVGVYLLRPVKVKPEEKKLPSFPVFTLIGMGVSCLANILGVGGGLFMVPILIFYNMNEKRAIGTSVAITFLICVCGALGYLIFGLQEKTYLPWSLGYIYLPAFFIVGIFSFLAAPYGAKWAHMLPTPLLRKIFAFAMITVGLVMIFA
jgi:uncharacterized protein